MNQLNKILIVFITLLILAPPASAFTAERLDIQVEESGAALVNFSYSLSWLEQIAVFLHIADPAREFAIAMERYTSQPVEDISMSGSTLLFHAPGFARVTEEEGGVLSYSTPGLRFTAAGDALRQYWFAPLIQVDISPALTTLRFPDGKEMQWIDQDGISPVIHRMVPAGAEA